MSAPVYLDHASAWPVDPRVAEAMHEALGWGWPSPDALHGWSRRPAEALEQARADVAALVGAVPEQVIFTSGPHEARALAVMGGLTAGGGVLTTAAEHPATLAICRSATRSTGGPTIVGVDPDGRVRPRDLAGALADETRLVCLTVAQPEIGTLQDIPGLVAAVRERRSDVRVHLDAGDTVGLHAVDMNTLDVDLLTIGGSTLGAPSWTGALVVRPGTRLTPLIGGGAQEHGKRGGPVNLPAAVGLGRAAALAMTERADRIAHITALDERLVEGLLRIPEVRLNGPRSGRLPGIVQVSLGWVEAQSVVLALAADGVACSAGSACTAVTRKAAPILEAIGLEAPWTHSAVLFSLGPTTTVDEIERALATIEARVRALRHASPIGRR